LSNENAFDSLNGALELDSNACADRRFIEKLASSLPEWIYVSDMDEKVFSYRNRDFLGYLGYAKNSEARANLAFLDLIHPSDRDSYLAHRQRVQIAQDEEAVESTCRLRTALNEWKWFQIRSVVFRRNDDGSPAEMIGTIQDVTTQMQHELQLMETVRQLRVAQKELRERQEQLEELNHQLAALATSDGLTGLYNYRAFHEKLAEEIRRSRRYDYPLTVVVTDVDDFKAYNDLFGHPAGDERLRQFAQMLEQDSRDSDFVARTGGEEFAMILINTTAADGAKFAQRLINRLNEETGSKRLTASFGCVQLESEDRTKEELLRRADDCLYKAKRLGKNRVVVVSMSAKTGLGV